MAAAAAAASAGTGTGWDEDGGEGVVGKGVRRGEKEVRASVGEATQREGWWLSWWK